MAKFAIPKKNIIYIIAGVVVMIIGYLFMLGGGSGNPEVFNDKLFSFTRLYIAPILILAGFGIEVFAVMYVGKSKEEDK